MLQLDMGKVRNRPVRTECSPDFPGPARDFELDWLSSPGHWTGPALDGSGPVPLSSAAHMTVGVQIDVIEQDS